MLMQTVHGSQTFSKGLFTNLRSTLCGKDKSPNSLPFFMGYNKAKKATSVFGLNVIINMRAIGMQLDTMTIPH